MKFNLKEVLLTHKLSLLFFMKIIKLNENEVIYLYTHIGRSLHITNLFLIQRHTKGINICVDFIFKIARSI